MRSTCSDTRVFRGIVALWFCGVLVAAGAAYAAEKQVANLRARHHAGQTFLTWQEVDPPFAAESVSAVELRRMARDADQQHKVRYRIYRSQQPIKTLEGLKPIAEVPPLACWNTDYYGDPQPKDPALRYVVEEGEAPLRPGTGLCVHNPRQAGKAYYAVTRSVDGKESTALGGGNSLQEPVTETVGEGVPVLQRVEKPESFQYVDRPTLYYFVRWESPPNCNVEGKPFDYVVGIPPKPAKPAPVGIHLHCWGGSLNGGYGWWYNAEKGDMLLASNQVPYDWWTGYHELLGVAPREEEAWQKGVVRPYTQARLLSFLDWMATRWDVDLARTHVAGSSMGGAGSPMMAIRFPDRIAWAVSWVGVHTPAQSPTFKGSYAQVYGEPEWQVKFEDGTPVWDYFDDTWYLRHHPEAEIGLILFSNGKNDGGIGWPQAAAFHRALQETHRPHVFVWGQSGHGQRATMPVTLEERVLPIDVRVDQSLPAFSGCSLDDRPGSGDPQDGDAQGQSNLYLFWETADVVDQPGRWEMTVGLIDRAPRDSCTVDITPRRTQQFKPKPGQDVKWSVLSSTGEVLQSGHIQADRWGLVTLPQVRVGTGKQRVRIGE